MRPMHLKGGPVGPLAQDRTGVVISQRPETGSAAFLRFCGALPFSRLALVLQGLALALTWGASALGARRMEGFHGEEGSDDSGCADIGRAIRAGWARKCCSAWLDELSKRGTGPSGVGDRHCRHVPDCGGKGEDQRGDAATMAKTARDNMRNTLRDFCRQPSCRR